MKRKYLVFSIVVLITSLIYSGCSLDEELYGIPNPASITKSKDVEVMVNGLYSTMNPYPFKLGIYALITTDDQKLFANNLTAENVSIANRTYDATDARSNLIWVNFFNMVGAANNLLDVSQTLEGKIDPVVLQDARGHAHFIRAFAYYYLVRLFGKVPIRTTSYTLEQEKFLARSSVDSVYDLIFSDFKRAGELLPLKTATSIRGKAGKEAAFGMLASASLTYANYLDYNKTGDKNTYFKQAKDYADSVIRFNTYSLVPDFAKLWDVANEASNYQSEVLFGIQYTRDPFDNTRLSKGSMFASQYSPVQTENSLTTVGWYPVQPYVLDEYNYDSGSFEGDYRIKVSFFTNWTRRNGVTFVSYPTPRLAGQNDGVYPYIKKYKDVGAEQFNGENDMYILRMAEIYLIYAEAENELNGPTADAYEKFNKLRERARKADGQASAFPKDLAPVSNKYEFRMAVFNERGLEFIGEDIKRFFDLIRMISNTGEAMFMYRIKNVINKIPEGRPIWNNAQQKYLGGRKTGDVFKAVTEKHLLLPVPKSQIDANPNLAPQNPGW